MRGQSRRAALDPARLRLLRLLHVNLEYAVAGARLDVLLRHALWDTECPRERAEAALEAMQAAVRFLQSPLALGRDRERALVELDRDLVFGNALSLTSAGPVSPD